MLRQLSKADSLRLLRGSEGHDYRLSPTVSERVIARFERTYDVTLPAEYRRFLRTAGGGGSANCAGPHGGLTSFGRVVKHTDLVDLARPFPLRPGEQLTPEQRDRDEDYAGTIELCSVGCGTTYRLVVTGPDRGRVWLWMPDAIPNEFEATGYDFIDWYVAWLREQLEAITKKRTVPWWSYLWMLVAALLSTGGTGGCGAHAPPTLQTEPTVPTPATVDAAHLRKEGMRWEP